MSGNSGENGSGPPEDDEFDRQRRRVLWALPTGLYLIGSRHDDAINFMTANLLTQVCIEPKLIGVAVQADSVTAGLIDQGQAFTVSMLARSDRDIVRRFVKPVAADQVERAADGTVTAMVGHAVTEVGQHKWPVLAAAAGYLLCQLTDQRPLGSHLFCIGEVIEVGGQPVDVLRMEDTRMHYGG